MTEIRLRAQSNWASNRNDQSIVNAVEPTVTVKCLDRRSMSSSGADGVTVGQEQQQMIFQHLQQQQQRMQHDRHELQQQHQQQELERQMEKEQVQQHVKQQLVQHERLPQLKQQKQRHLQEEEQQLRWQQMQNEQMQQRRQQLMQHDQQQQQCQQQQGQDCLTSPGNTITCSAFSSSSAPSVCSSTASYSFSLSSSLPSDSSDSDRYKTELCRSYGESGSCRYGNKCLFAHGRVELRLLDRHPKYKTEFCRTYHSSGFCPYGQRCHFIHSCQNSPLAVVGSPGQAIGTGEASNMGSIGQTPMVLVGQEWNEVQQKKSVEPDRRIISELGQRFNEEERRFNEPERLRNDLIRKLSEMELERNTGEYDRKHLELIRKSLEPNSKITQAERTFVEAERKPFELELSAILQRRRRQLRCGSVGSSSCETPPPFMAGLDNTFNPSLASSPLDDVRSPFYPTSSPLNTYSNPVDIPRSAAVRYGISRNLKGSPDHPTNHLGLSFTPPKGIGFGQTPPWTLSDALASGSTPRTWSPGRHPIPKTSSSSARHQGTFFLFDGDTLARLIQRS